MISDRAAIELLWSETGRDGSPPDEYGDPVLTQAFADMLPVLPRMAYLFLYETNYGLDVYVRAWLASLDDMPVRWSLALFLRYGIITGRSESWAEIGRRMGITVPTAREHAAKGLAYLWAAYAGLGDENLHQLRAAAQEELREPGHGGRPGVASNANVEDEELWQPTYAESCKTWYTGAKMQARFSHAPEEVPKHLPAATG